MHIFPQLAWSPRKVFSAAFFLLVFCFTLLLRPVTLGTYLLFFFSAVAFASWYSGVGTGLFFSALAVPSGYFLLPGGVPAGWTVATVLLTFAAFASAALLVPVLRAGRYLPGDAAANRQLRLLLGRVPAITWSTDRSLRIHALQAGDGVPAAALPKRLPFPVQQLFDSPSGAPLAAHRAALADRDGHFELEWEDATYQVQVEPVRNSQGAVTGVTGLALAGSGKERVPTRADAELEMLRLVARSLPFPEALDELARLVERYLPATYCSLLLLDEHGERLQRQAAPSLPAPFRQATGPVALRLLTGPCRKPVTADQRLVVTDIVRDPLWALCHEVAREYRLPICRSVPVCAEDGRSLGALALYHGRARDLSALEHEVVEVAVHIARILIEREWAKQYLEENEQRYRSLFDHNPDAVFSLDQEGKFLSANPAAGLISGYDAAELVGSSFALLVAPEHLELAWRAFEQVIQGRSQDAELTIFHKQGHPVHLHVTTLPMVVNNEIVGLYGVAKDITMRRRVEEAQHFLVEASRILTSSLDYETTLRNVANQAVSFIADCCVVDIVDDDGKIVQLAIAIADDVEAQSAAEIKQLYSSGGACRAPVNEVMRTGHPLLSVTAQPSSDALYHGTGCGPQGECELPVGSYMVVPLVAREQMLGAISLFTLECNHHYSEEDLVLAEELAGRAALAIDNARLYHEAEQAIRARDQFFSIASHELKTPVTSLIGYTYLLNRQVDRQTTVDSRLKRGMDTIHTQASRLNRLIDLLLDVSRIQEGDLLLECRPVDLVGTIERIVEFLHPSLERHQLEFHCALEMVWVEGDELRLEQAFQNLLLNAVKYSPDGGRITITLERNEGRVHVSIADEGIGIPADALSNLFDRFYRAENVERSRVGGMGLGLHIVHHIIEAHGGTIGVTSEVGRGSTFTIELPVVFRVNANDLLLS